MKQHGLTLTSGDIVDVDLGTPAGREAGFRHPAVVVTSQRILDAAPSIIHVVPLTSTIRGFGSELHLEPDDTNGLDRPSAAQCQHIRAISRARAGMTRGNIGTAAVAHVRQILGLILDVDA